ncbi:unnamed protein product [Adineta ricciae]|uniref:CUB domain-containing protein n=1 Tax=Adineta ricciae TaxID=249248 RepID=A0A814XD70_ADIRI|nr:unnamed protein product [Adineta ricciae]
MLIHCQTILCDVLSHLLLVVFINTSVLQAQALSRNDRAHNHIARLRQAEEIFMTSVPIDGMKRSHVCGDGYRIEGALLKSYPYSRGQTYSPYEDCYMTFQARRSNNLIRIRILTMDINDIHRGINCLDSLRFYKSPYILEKDKLNSVECGQLNESQNFSFISPTGVVTVHFSTDGGNVNGLGFKVVLTSFHYPSHLHPCDSTDDEFLCGNGECISSSLLCDGVPHCLDGSDEGYNHSCSVRSTDSVNHMTPDKYPPLPKYQQWRGILIIAFFLIILFVFILFTIYFLCRRCCCPNEISIQHTANIRSEVNHRKHGARTRVITHNNRNYKHFHDNRNLV